MMSEDTKAQLLAEHYRDSVAEIMAHVRFRDRLFALLLVLGTVVLFQLFAPGLAAKIITEFVRSRLAVASAPDVSFVGGAIWFTFLAVLIRYFQTVIHVERQYTYVHSLEDLLSAEYGGKAFTREGKTYLSRYPAFCEFASWIYVWLFPAIVVLVAVEKVIHDLSAASRVDVLLVVNLGISASILVAVALYLLMIHFKR